MRLAQARPNDHTAHTNSPLAPPTDAVGAGPAKDDDVQQAVGAQPVGAVHAGAGGLAGGKEAGHDGVGVAALYWGGVEGG